MDTEPPPPPPLGVLVIPGLGGSGEGHWQSWLEAQYALTQRVHQRDWHTPDLNRWADRIDATLQGQGRMQWVAVAHSFGALALVRFLQRRQPQANEVRAALLVAPAEPRKFGLASVLEAGGQLGLPTQLIGSRTDPWMSVSSARQWAQTWGAEFTDLGDVGHINVESGHGRWPLGRRIVDDLVRRCGSGQAPRTTLEGDLAWVLA